MYWLVRKGLFLGSLVSWWYPVPWELMNVPVAVCWAGMRCSPVLPKVSVPVPFASMELSWLYFCVMASLPVLMRCSGCWGGDCTCCGGCACT